jgi:hypothetical protein
MTAQHCTLVSISKWHKKWVIIYEAETGNIKMQKPESILKNKNQKKPVLILEYNPTMKLIQKVTYFNHTS